MSGKYFVPGFSTTIGFRCIALLCFLFAIQQHCYAQKGKGTDRLYYTQLKTAEAYYRHNQIGEAKIYYSQFPQTKELLSGSF